MLPPNRGLSPNPGILALPEGHGDHYTPGAFTTQKMTEKKFFNCSTAELTLSRSSMHILPLFLTNGFFLNLAFLRAVPIFFLLPLGLIFFN